MEQSKKKNTYATKQGRLILDCLQGSGGNHLTTEQISEELKNNGTPVGTATIYRQLQKLVDEGLVIKYSSADSTDSACFQFLGENCQEHFHLKCTKCGRLIHAKCPFLSQINTHIFEHHAFTVDNTRTVFYGVCADCAESEKQRAIPDKTDKKDTFNEK